MKIIDKLLLLKGAIVNKLSHDVDRNNCRQKSTESRQDIIEKHYQFSH